MTLAEALAQREQDKVYRVGPALCFGEQFFPTMTDALLHASKVGLMTCQPVTIEETAVWVDYGMANGTYINHNAWHPRRRLTVTEESIT